MARVLVAQTAGDGEVHAGRHNVVGDTFLLEHRVGGNINGILLRN